MIQAELHKAGPLEEEIINKAAKLVQETVRESRDHWGRQRELPRAK